MKIADSNIHTRYFNFVELNHRFINFDIGRAPIRLCRSQWRVHQVMMDGRFGLTGFTWPRKIFLQLKNYQIDKK